MGISSCSVVFEVLRAVERPAALHSERLAANLLSMSIQRELHYQVCVTAAQVLSMFCLLQLLLVCNCVCQVTMPQMRSRVQTSAPMLI
jgi:hypothetical protein